MASTDPAAHTDTQHTEEILVVSVAEERTEESTQLRESVSKVFSIPELLTSALSYLPIKDLTRALGVSKVWYQAILGSIELRRNLFLEPSLLKEYLGIKKKCGRDQIEISGRLYAPVITSKPTRRYNLIVEPRPFLLENFQPEKDGCISLSLVSSSLARLNTIRPSTLLFQPPLENIVIASDFEDSARLKCIGGATFGAVLGAFERLKNGRGTQCDDRSETIYRESECESNLYLGSIKGILNTSELVIEGRKLRAEGDS